MDLSINCQATPGNPSSTTFYWTNNQGFRQNGATLQIYIIQRTSSGTYRCTAENNYGNGEKGTDSQSMDVNVQCMYSIKRSIAVLNNLINRNLSCNSIIIITDPPFVSLLSKKNILEGRNLSVTCQANSGNPSFTTFYWTRADNPGFRQNEAILQLPDIQRTSSGTYICTAENSYNNGNKGTHSQTMVVNVLCKSYIRSFIYKMCH